MSLSCVATAIVLTNQLPAPVVGGGTDASTILNCFQGSPSRLVLDVKCLTAVVSVLLYRWNEELFLWMASMDGALSLVVGANETRWDTSGIAGYYCLRIESGSGTASYSQRKVPQ